MVNALQITDEIGIGFGSITAPVLTSQQAQMDADEIKTYIVATNIGDPGICIDGRRSVFNGVIGPKLAGGFKSLMVGAKSIGYRLSGKALHDEAKKQGFNLTAHVDSANAASGFVGGTGCGANDKEKTITQLFNDNKNALEPTVKALVGGDGYDQGFFGDLKLVHSTDDTNELKDIVGEENTEVLEATDEGVHGHQEWAVYFNYVEGTTIDRDAYFNATGKQVFVVDMWYIKKLADAMGETEVQASELYHAMVAYQVATYIGLCDGTHRAIIATQKVGA
jgi:hypothetical protein